MKSRNERKELIEILDKLYYPTQITTGTFKHPNFEELAEILYFFTHRFHPNTTIHGCIDSESDRVEFIKSVVIFFFHADLHLDAIKLYHADKKCVSELIKVGNFLLDAMDIEKDQEVSTAQRKKVALIEPKKIDRIKYLTSKLTETGANLHSLLQEETKVELDCSEFHNLIQSIIVEGNEVASTKESDSFHDAMNRILEQKKNDLHILQEEIDEIKADQHDLQLNIQRKKEDIERNENRLKSLQSTKPTFMNELKALEDDLQKHYDLYMERYRNIHYLQCELKRHKESEVKLLRKQQFVEDQRGIVLDNNKMPSPTKSEQASTHSSNESSHQTSSELSSNAPSSHLGSTSNSSTLSISVDTTTSFLQNENEISPISKESSDDSDDDF